jgi:hypothetical protein
MYPCWSAWLSACMQEVPLSFWRFKCPRHHSHMQKAVQHEIYIRITMYITLAYRTCHLGGKMRASGVAWAVLALVVFQSVTVQSAADSASRKSHAALPVRTDIKLGTATTHRTAMAEISCPQHPFPDPDPSQAQEMLCDTFEWRL